MKNITLVPTDKMLYYGKIMDSFCKGDINKKWLCDKGEKSYSSELRNYVTNTINNVGNLGKESIFVQWALVHELKKCTDEKDKECLQYLYIGIKTIRSSFMGMFDKLCTIRDQLENYDIKENCDLAKAIIRNDRIHEKRTAEKRKLIREEYLFLSLVRPYYFYLQKKGISFTEDINNHVNMHNRWKDEREKFNAYFNIILDFAEKSGNKNHINARLEEYKKIKNRNQREREHKKAISKERTLERQTTKINNFTSHWENTYKKQTWRIMKTVVNLPNYSLKYKSCCVIVALCRINGQEVFRYFTGSALTDDIHSAAFYFDDSIKDIDKYKEECSKCEDVCVVSTLVVM